MRGLVKYILVLSLGGCLTLTFSEDNQYLTARWETIRTATMTTTIMISLRPDHPPAEVDSLRFEYDISLRDKNGSAYYSTRSGSVSGVSNMELVFTYPDSIFSTFVLSVILYESDTLLEQLSQNYIPVQTWDTIKEP